MYMNIDVIDRPRTPFIIIFNPFKSLLPPTPSITTQLFAHRASAVHIQGFYPKPAALEMARRLTADPSRQREWLVASPGRGLESSDVRTVGLQPYNMVASARDGGVAEAAYFDGALACMRELRGPAAAGAAESPPPAGGKGATEGGTSAVADSSSSSPPPPLPVLGPLDKLRLELDEVWPAGANVTKDKKGRAFVAGLARVMVRVWLCDVCDGELNVFCGWGWSARLGFLKYDVYHKASPPPKKNRTPPPHHTPNPPKTHTQNTI